MKRTKKMTVSALSCAVSIVILLLGSLIQTVDLTVVAIASLVVVFVHIEIGAPYNWLVWICTSLLALLLLPSKSVGLEYAVFGGVYPILKDYLERIPRWLSRILKLVVFNALLIAMIALTEFVLGIEFFGAENIWIKAGLYLLMNFTFLIYDLLITRLVIIYNLKYRERVEKFLKR